MPGDALKPIAAESLALGLMQIRLLCCSRTGTAHPEILWYLSMHFASTLAVLPNLIVQRT